MSKRRNRYLAVVLTLAAPGLGQLYNGQWSKALIYPLAVPLVYTALYATLPHMPYNGWSILPLVLIALVLIAGAAFLAAEAWDTAVRLGDRFRPRWFNTGWAYLLFALLSHLVMTTGVRLKDSVATWYEIPAGSMRRTILPGDRILVDRLAYRVRGARAAGDPSGPGPARGDLVVFLFPGDRRTPYVKRVIGLPGEQVEIRDNLVFIDGEILHEPYATWGVPESFGPVVVGEDAYFLLGDNRPHSSDSRVWGTVSRDLILGKVDRVLWSVDPLGRLRLDRVGKRLE